MKSRDSGLGIRDSQLRPHQRLEVWQDAKHLVEAIYGFSADFPDAKRFGLTARIRRATISIPSTVAEGAARRSTPEHVHFLSIARGSLSEPDTQGQPAVRRAFAQQRPDSTDVVDRLFARLDALIRSLQTRKTIVPDSSATLSPESRIPNPESHAR